MSETLRTGAASAKARSLRSAISQNFAESSGDFLLRRGFGYENRRRDRRTPLAGNAREPSRLRHVTDYPAASHSATYRRTHSAFVDTRTLTLRIIRRRLLRQCHSQFLMILNYIFDLQEVRRNADPCPHFGRLSALSLVSRRCGFVQQSRIQRNSRRQCRAKCCQRFLVKPTGARRKYYSRPKKRPSESSSKLKSELRDRRNEVQRSEQRLAQKEENSRSQARVAEQRAEQPSAIESKDLEEQRSKLTEVEEARKVELERLSNLTVGEAREHAPRAG